MPIESKCNIRKLVFLYILPVCLTAGTVSAENGLQILKQAEDTMGSISFSAKFDYKDGGSKIKNELIQRKMERGRHEFRREIVIEMQGIVLTNVYLLNKNGLWHILPDQALRMDFETSKQSALAGLLENAVDTSTEADYGTVLEQINGRELIVVSQKPRPLTGGPLPKRTQIVEKKIFIGRNDHIVYGCDLRRGDGTVAKMTVTELTLLDKIPDAVFELPAGLPEIVCTNSSQHAQIMLHKMQDLAKTPGVRDAIQSFQKKNRKYHYAVLSLMFIPTIFLAWFLLRGKFK
jgi:hypothetical protein